MARRGCADNRRVRYLRSVRKRDHSDRGCAPAERRERHVPRLGEPGWFPDEERIRRAEFAATTPAERVIEAIELSRFATRVAVAGRARE